MARLAPSAPPIHPYKGADRKNCLPCVRSAQGLTPKSECATGKSALPSTTGIVSQTCQEAPISRRKKVVARRLEQKGQRSFAIAAFVNNMNARPDCELPHHLAALGVLLLSILEVAGVSTIILSAVLLAGVVYSIW